MAENTNIQLLENFSSHKETDLIKEARAQMFESKLQKAIRLLQVKEYEFGVLTVCDTSTNPFEILAHYINTL